MEKIREIVKKIQENRSAFNRRMNEIRADNNLSEDGKRNAINQELEKARKVHQQLMDEYNRQIKEIGITLRRSAFSPVTLFMDKDTEARVLMRHQDNVERFSKLPKEDLMAALRRAKDLDDANMARSICHAAFERGLHDVVNAVAEEFPTEKDCLDELYEFERTYGSLKDKDRKFTEKIELSGPAIPPAHIG